MGTSPNRLSETMDQTATTKLHNNHADKTYGETPGCTITRYLTREKLRAHRPRRHRRLPSVAHRNTSRQHSRTIAGELRTPPRGIFAKRQVSRPMGARLGTWLWNESALICITSRWSDGCGCGGPARRLQVPSKYLEAPTQYWPARRQGNEPDLVSAERARMYLQRLRSDLKAAGGLHFAAYVTRALRCLGR